MIAVLALSEPGWAFLGLLVVQVFAFAALFVRQGKTSTSIAQINTAVNHQGSDQPTLVQRVANLERSEQSAVVHRVWERDALCSLAREVGCHLPAYPHDTNI